MLEANSVGLSHKVLTYQHVHLHPLHDFTELFQLSLRIQDAMYIPMIAAGEDPVMSPRTLECWLLVEIS